MSELEHNAYHPSHLITHNQNTKIILSIHYNVTTGIVKEQFYPVVLPTNTASENEIVLHTESNLDYE